MGRACAASDLYSLAIVAVYLFSGVPPENLEIQDYHVLIDSHLEHLPYLITAFLRAMLEPRIEDRITDYDKIREFFSAIKEQKFEAIPKIETHISQKKYSLDQVYSYRQPGNIVLWQTLKDSTPRHLPFKYIKESLIKLLPFTFGVFFRPIIIIFSILIIIGTISALFTLFDDNTNLPPAITGTIFGITFVVCMVIYLKKEASISSHDYNGEMQP